MGYANMASILRTGDETIKNLNLSLRVFFNAISVDFNRHLDTLKVVERRLSRTD